jgi:hypothetical protein
MSVTIYGIPGSPYVRAALLGCEEKGGGLAISTPTPPVDEQAFRRSNRPNENHLAGETP